LKLPSVLRAKTTFETFCGSRDEGNNDILRAELVRDNGVAIEPLRLLSTWESILNNPKIKYSLSKSEKNI
jgi:hypothetical protein